jgi:hypothetical protein
MSAKYRGNKKEIQMARKKSPAEFRVIARKMLESAKKQKLSQAPESALQSIRSNNAEIIE